ncbi:hypothetical protein BJX63DRAFT_344078 [Aspergillus granulosus]|uniref:Uncharacterized protein n=1 Tax=Aspergillus granulosus TaxID=176169 RepID=A0ABR4H4C4_9EURO
MHAPTSICPPLLQYVFFFFHSPCLNLPFPVPYTIRTIRRDLLFSYFYLFSLTRWFN